MITYQTAIDDRKDCPLIAIDLGYSNNQRTCGIVHTYNKEPRSLKFGDTINEVVSLVEQYGPLILILEAVLSTYHNEYGNPEIRGDFEKGRGWYHGAGVLTYAAAIRFLRMLRQNCNSNSVVYLAEAFLSFEHGSHPADALIIFNHFWETQPERLKDGTEPILDFIDGIPSVRVFKRTASSRG